MSEDSDVCHRVASHIAPMCQVLVVECGQEGSLILFAVNYTDERRLGVRCWE